MAVLLFAMVMTMIMAADRVSGDVDMKIAAMKTQLESKIGEVEEAIEDLTKKIELLSQNTYFKATFQELPMTSQPNQIVVFDKVLDNIGNAYQPTTGIFTAPRPGVYIFAVQMFARGSVDANWDLHVNNQRVLRSRTMTLDETSNEYVFPVTLRAGDQVFVYSEYNAFTCWGTDHSFFAGWIFMPL